MEAREGEVAMFLRYVLIASASLLLAGGCASITRGTMDSLVVESDPSGATVEISRKDREFTKAEVEQNTVSDSGAIVGATPSSFRLKREGEYNVVVSKDGYETIKSEVSHSVAGGGAAGMAGNVLLGGVIGAVVDSNTGAMLNLSPNPLKVVLHPVGEADDSGDNTPEDTSVASPDDDTPEDVAETVGNSEEN